MLILIIIPVVEAVGRGWPLVPFMLLTAFWRMSGAWAGPLGWDFAGHLWLAMAGFEEKMFLQPRHLKASVGFTWLSLCVFIRPSPPQIWGQLGHLKIWNSSHKKPLHNSPIYDECKTQSTQVLALPWKRAHQDDSNDTPQPIGECQVRFSLQWIRINQVPG